MRQILIYLSVGLWMISLHPTSTYGQLNQLFNNVFNQILKEDFQLSPGEHAEHYIPAAELASSSLTPALNSLISSQIASFPLSATVSAVTFDFSAGQPVSTTESLGPIFVESAETLGKQKLVFGFNAAHLSFDRFRGLPTNQMRFTFTHEDVLAPGLGDSPNESDVVDLLLGLDVTATIFVFFATYGITNHLDVGLAIPYIDISLNGTATAKVNSFTFGAIGRANHQFGSDSLRPLLVDKVPYSGNATGQGDIALRFKYQGPITSQTLNTGLLLDIRVPTGDPHNFLGTGAVNLRLSALGTLSVGDLNLHLNTGYDYRGAHLDSHELEVAAGFDQKLSPNVTAAAGLLGAFDINSKNVVRLFPGTVVITDHAPDTGAKNKRRVSLSNIPNRTTDHTIDLSMGLHIAPTDSFNLLANILVPLQDGGLRSRLVPTLGYSLRF